MRINRIQSDNVNFRALQVRYADSFCFQEKDIMHYKDKLANTKVFDVVIDSHGLALKEKMTDVLHRIQSFSLFPQDNAVGIRMIGEEVPAYLLNYSTKDEAKSEWQSLCGLTSKTSLDVYTKVALWLEERLATKN